MKVLTITALAAVMTASACQIVRSATCSRVSRSTPEAATALIRIDEDVDVEIRVVKQNTTCMQAIALSAVSLPLRVFSSLPTASPLVPAATATATPATPTTTTPATATAAPTTASTCPSYTSDAADEENSVELVKPRILYTQQQSDT